MVKIVLDFKEEIKFFMNKIIKEISFFLPSFNEEKNIKKSVLNVKKVLEEVADKWEIVIIDDGSKDKTGEIADDLSVEYKNNIRVVHNKPNRGYGGALKSGYEASKYEWIAFADSDGQFNYSEIIKFISKQKESNADLVLGIRSNRADSFVRKIYTVVWSKILPKVLFGLRVTDYSCGFKLIKKEVYQKVQPLVGEEKVTQIELLIKAQRMGYKFAEIEVKHLPRKFGKQTGANIKVIVRSVRDLFKLWCQLR
jgi:glycosyltransferase involved in cell wall biosynthesis